MSLRSANFSTTTHLFYSKTIFTVHTIGYRLYPIDFIVMLKMLLSIHIVTLCTNFNFDMHSTRHTEILSLHHRYHRVQHFKRSQVWFHLFRVKNWNQNTSEGAIQDTFVSSTENLSEGKCLPLATSLPDYANIYCVINETSRHSCQIVYALLYVINNN
jgi:hypothetical protein